MVLNGGGVRFCGVRNKGKEIVFDCELKSRVFGCRFIYLFFRLVLL